MLKEDATSVEGVNVYPKLLTIIFNQTHAYPAYSGKKNHSFHFKPAI